MPQSQVSYVCSGRVSRIEVDACWTRPHMPHPNVLVHLQLPGVAPCWALDLCEHLPRSAPFETALRKLNRKEEARPLTCSLVSASDRFVNRAAASIMGLVVGFVMSCDNSAHFSRYSSWWSTSAIFSLVQVPASIAPHRSPYSRPRWRVKVFHGPQEASGASRLQPVPICASC